jgi:predicted Zn-dependent peptidase
MRRRALAAVLSATLAGSAAAGSFDVETGETAGSARLVLAPRPGRRATLVVQFAQGSVDDDRRSGLTRLAQHVLLTANSSLDWAALVTALHAGGGSLTLRTDLHSSAFVLEADRREFDELAPKLVAGVFAPRIDPARYRAAIQRALHDAREPGHGAGLLDLVARAASDDPRYYNDPTGDPDQIEFVEQRVVEALLAGPMGPANATVIAAGSFDRDRLVRAARPFAGGRRVAPAPPPFALPVRATRYGGRELRVLAWPLAIEWPRDAAVARLVAALAERVLWRRFREAGLAYSFDVEAALSPGVDLFIVALPVRSDTRAGAAEALAAAMDDVRAGNFDDAQLERARAIAIGQLAREDRDPEVLALALAAGGAAWHGRLVDAALRGLDRRTLVERAGRLLAPERSIALHFSPLVARTVGRGWR